MVAANPVLATARRLAEWLGVGWFWISGPGQESQAWGGIQVAQQL
jgi:hypothetical protein